MDIILTPKLCALHYHIKRSQKTDNTDTLTSSCKNNLHIDSLNKIYVGEHETKDTN